MGVIGKKVKSKAKKTKVGKIASKLIGGSSRKRTRGVTYWSNKVLVEKLKKKFNRLKYGSVR